MFAGRLAGLFWDGLFVWILDTCDFVWRKKSVNRFIAYNAGNYRTFLFLKKSVELQLPEGFVLISSAKSTLSLLESWSDKC